MIVWDLSRNCNMMKWKSCELCFWVNWLWWFVILLIFFCCSLLWFVCFWFNECSISIINFGYYEKGFIFVVVLKVVMRDGYGDFCYKLLVRVFKWLWIDCLCSWDLLICLRYYLFYGLSLYIVNWYFFVFVIDFSLWRRGMERRGGGVLKKMFFYMILLLLWVLFFSYKVVFERWLLFVILRLICFFWRWFLGVFYVWFICCGGLFYFGFFVYFLLFGRVEGC